MRNCQVCNHHHNNPSTCEMDETHVGRKDSACSFWELSDSKHDRMEREDRAFHERVRQGYLEIARCHTERVCVIDGRTGATQVAGAIWKAVAEMAGRRSPIVVVGCMSVTSREPQRFASPQLGSSSSTRDASAPKGG